MTSEASKRNHRATIYIYWIFVLGILGPAAPNTPVLAYDHWGFQDQPQGHTLHVLDFLIGHFRASHIKHNSFGIWPVRLLRATQGHYLHILDFWIGNFWAGHTKHTRFGIWPVGLPRSTTRPQFTYTGFFNRAFWGRPHQTHQYWHMTSGAYKINHRATIYIYWIFELGILGPATPNTPVLAHD